MKENAIVKIVPIGNGGGGVYSDLANGKSMSSFLVMVINPDDAEDWYGILLDAGYLTLDKLMKMGIDLSKIRVIFLSHLHVDHCYDLPLVAHARFRLWASKNKLMPAGQESPLEPLIIYCPKGYEEIFWDLAKQFGDTEFTKERHPETIFCPGVQNTEAISTALVTHADNLQCLAIVLRIAGKVIVYTGDMTNDAANDQVIAGLAKDPDALIGEASDSDNRFHRSIEDAIRLFVLCGANILIVCHVHSGYMQTVQEVCVGSGGLYVMAEDAVAITI